MKIKPQGKIKHAPVTKSVAAIWVLMVIETFCPAQTSVMKDNILVHNHQRFKPQTVNQTTSQSKKITTLYNFPC